MAYFFSVAEFFTWSFHTFSTVAITSGGTVRGMKMPKWLAGALNVGSVLVSGSIVP